MVLQTTPWRFDIKVKHHSLIEKKSVQKRFGVKVWISLFVIVTKLKDC